MERKNERLPVFTERFRELQGEQSNTEFAEFLGISRQTVGFYCNGDRVPDAVTLIKIAERCNVSTDWLLGRLGSVKTLNEDVNIVVKYIGLSESAVEVLHSDNGFLLKGTEIGTAYILSKIIESPCFSCLINNLAQSMYCGAYLPEATHTEQISREDDEKFLRWARDNGYEVVDRNSVYEMHLQCAANNLSDIWDTIVSDEAEKRQNNP